MNDTDLPIPTPATRPRRAVCTAIAAIAAFAVLVLAASPTLAADDDNFSDKFLQLGTGPVGGAFRPIGEAICDAVDKDRPATLVRCVPVGTAGSTYNLHAVDASGMQLGLAQEDLVAAMYKGEPRGSTLRIIATLHTSPIGVVVRRDAGIHALREIAGKRMNLGNRGSGQFTITASILKALNLRTQDLGGVSYMATNDFEKAFCEHQVDVVVEAVAHPSPLYQHLLDCGGQFVDIPPDVVARMIVDNPLLSAMSIPANTYASQTETVSTLGMRNLLFTAADVDEETIYRFTTSLLKREPELKRSQPMFASMVAMNADTAKTLPAPLHPGAERALRDFLKRGAR